MPKCIALPSVTQPQPQAFVLCRQGSSLLWTPALKPLYQSHAPAQGEEGNWKMCAVYVHIV